MLQVYHNPASSKSPHNSGKWVGRHKQRWSRRTSGARVRNWTLSWRQWEVAEEWQAMVWVRYKISGWSSEYLPRRYGGIQLHNLVSLKVKKKLTTKKTFELFWTWHIVTFQQRKAKVKPSVRSKMQTLFLPIGRQKAYCNQSLLFHGHTHLLLMAKYIPEDRGIGRPASGFRGKRWT